VHLVGFTVEPHKYIDVFYIHSDLLHVSANHVAIFRDVKYNVQSHSKL